MRSDIWKILLHLEDIKKNRVDFNAQTIVFTTFQILKT